MKVYVLVALLVTFTSSEIAFARGNSRPSFSEIDVNGDGKVALEEFSIAAKGGRRSPAERFKRIDANSDGFLQQEEMDAMRAKRGNRSGGRRGN